jgi:hypothetical protein
MNDLATLPTLMARTVAGWLPAVNEARYVTYLDVMVHYTRASGDRLRHAASIARNPALRCFFGDLAADEENHWRLAAADLAAFGRTPSIPVPPEVIAFDRFWRAIPGEEELTLLGALHVLESVGGHIQADARVALGRLGVTRQQARFVSVHLEIDEDHSARAEALCRELGGRDPVALRRGASEAAAHWLAIHRRALA